jgi:4-amino-4-deoxy-L-arabinose transferase-like glycosyltransferase
MDGQGSALTLRRTTLAWLAALLVGAAALAAVSYRARDPDSRLYAEISARLAERPVREWIAPKFPEGWYLEGYFREHPAGLFWLPALAGRLGYPPAQAAYAANALYQILTLVLCCALAAALVEGIEARALAVLLQLLPVAFTYRIRANHEQALLLFLLLALYGAERARRRVGWAAVIAVGLVGVLLVKGLFAVVAAVACAIWVLARRAAPGSSRAALLGLVAGVAVTAAAALLYDSGHRAVTGEAFWAVNLGRQLGVASAPRSSAFWLDKSSNLVWYAARVLWFAFPWSLVLAWRSVGMVRRSAACPPGGARDGLLFAQLFGLFALLAFSLSDRRADRYLFPVYYAVGAAGAVIGLRVFPRMRALFDRLDRHHPLPAVAVWLLTFGLHLLGGLVGLPTVKVWPPG